MTDLRLVVVGRGRCGLLCCWLYFGGVVVAVAVAFGRAAKRAADQHATRAASGASGGNQWQAVTRHSMVPRPRRVFIPLF